MLRGYAQGRNEREATRRALAVQDSFLDDSSRPAKKARGAAAAAGSVFPQLEMVSGADATSAAAAGAVVDLSGDSNSNAGDVENGKQQAPAVEQYIDLVDTPSTTQGTQGGGEGGGDNGSRYPPGGSVGGYNYPPGGDGDGVDVSSV